MPVITEIKQQKKAASRYSIYLDNKYAFSLSDLDLSTSGLRIGHSLSEQELEDWQQRSEEGKAHAQALRYLSYRSRSQREIKDCLARKSYDPELIDRVIVRLVGMGLLDDAAFAASWIAERQRLRPRSRRQLEQELGRKGIDREVSRIALDELGNDGQMQMLDDLIVKKRRLPQYQDETRLMSYLARQGFGYTEIKKALTHLDD